MKLNIKYIFIILIIGGVYFFNNVVAFGDSATPPEISSSYRRWGSLYTKAQTVESAKKMLELTGYGGKYTLKGQNFLKNKKSLKDMGFKFIKINEKKKPLNVYKYENIPIRLVKPDKKLAPLKLPEKQEKTYVEKFGFEKPSGYYELFCDFENRMNLRYISVSGNADVSPYDDGASAYDKVKFTFLKRFKDSGEFEGCILAYTDSGKNLNEEKFEIERFLLKYKRKYYKLALGNITKDYSYFTIDEDILGGNAGFRLGSFKGDFIFGVREFAKPNSQYLVETSGFQLKQDFNFLSQSGNISFNFVKSKDIDASLTLKPEYMPQENQVASFASNISFFREKLDIYSEIAASNYDSNTRSPGDEKSGNAYKIKCNFRGRKFRWRGELLHVDDDFQSRLATVPSDIRKFSSKLLYKWNDYIETISGYNNIHYNNSGKITPRILIDEVLAGFRIEPFTRVIPVQLKFNYKEKERKTRDRDVFERITATDLRFLYKRGALKTEVGILSEAREDYKDFANNISTHVYLWKLKKHLTHTLSINSNFSYKKERYEKINQADITRGLELGLKYKFNLFTTILWKFKYDYLNSCVVGLDLKKTNTIFEFIQNLSRWNELKFKITSKDFSYMEKGERNHHDVEAVISLISRF